MKPVFVDTGAWYALQVADDAHHIRAVDVLQDLVGRRAPLLTTELVLGETWTLLRVRRGFLPARRFLELARASRRLDIVPLQALDAAAAWEWLERYEDQDLSFVDATSFGAMRARGLDVAFAFDAHFRTAGFSLL